MTAWLVHAFTATGAVLAYLALEAAVTGDVRAAFLWLSAATLVDAVDGGLARLARVKERTPQFDGALLDNIIDYLTFVFVPVFVLRRQGLLPDGAAGVAVAAAVLLSSAYGFSRLDAKTGDHFFTGFPSYWNIVALYIAVLGLPAWANAAMVLAFAALVFVRIGYVYPTRTPALRRTTLALMAAWGLMLLAIIWWMPAPPRALVLASLVFPIYYMGLSLMLHARRAR